MRGSVNECAARLSEKSSSTLHELNACVRHKKSVNKKSKVSERVEGEKSTCEKGQHFSTFSVVYHWMAGGHKHIQINVEKKDILYKMADVHI